MKANGPRVKLLTALFDMAQSVEIIDVLSLSQRSQLDLYQVLKTLQELQAQGLVDAARLRLTLSGLAAAAGLGATRERRRLGHDPEGSDRRGMVSDCHRPRGHQRAA